MTEQREGRTRAWRTRGLVLVSAGAVVVGALVLIGNDGGDQEVGTPIATDEETTATTIAIPTSTTTTARVMLPTSTTATTAPRIESACNHPVERKAPPPEVEVWVTLDKSVYARGEPVVATVHVRNRTDAPFDYVETHGGRNDEIHIVAQSGMVLWRVTGAYPGNTTDRTLQPGEERTGVHRWVQNYCTGSTQANPEGHSSPGSVPPGRYTAQGMWRSGWWAPPVEFEIR